MSRTTCHGCPFTAAWWATRKFGYSCSWHRALKSSWEHIYALLGSNGYQSVEGGWGGLVAALSSYEMPEPILPDEALDVELSNTPMFPGSFTGGSLPTVVLRVSHRGEQVGFSETRPYAMSCWVDESEDTCFTRAIEVKESERGRGIGRYLMGRSLFEMQKYGCRHAILNTQSTNFPALMLYVSMGYRIVYRMCNMLKDPL